MSCDKAHICELCGEPADLNINVRWFCRAHARQGAIREARLEAFLKGAPPETIQAAGRWMAEALDDLEVLREEEGNQ
jgi:hypothetical protein